MFKKIVAHLAYSPALLWQLGQLDQKNRQELKLTSRLLILVFISIFLWTILWLSNPKQELNKQHIKLSGPDQMTEQISTNVSGKIRPGQPLNRTLSITNNTDAPYSDHLHFDFSGLNQYFTLINDSEVFFSESAKDYVWTISELPPNSTAYQTINFQSLNDFGASIVNSSDICEQSITFGNTLELEVDCNFIKMSQIKLLSFFDKIPFNFYAILLMFSILLGIIKLFYWFKLKTTIKITKLIRQQINQGRFLL